MSKSDFLRNPCGHCLSRYKKIGKKDKGSRDQPGYRVHVEQEAKAPVCGKERNYPENTEYTGAHNCDHGRCHGISHTAHGRTGDFIEGHHPLESQDMRKTNHRVLHDLRICRKQGEGEAVRGNEQKIHCTRSDHGEEHAQAKDFPASVIFSGCIILAREGNRRLVKGVYDVKCDDLKIQGGRRTGRGG